MESQLPGKPAAGQFAFPCLNVVTLTEFTELALPSAQGVFLNSDPRLLTFNQHI